MFPRLLLVMGLLALTGCRNNSQIAGETLELKASDRDGDGYVSDDDMGGHDCDDAKADVNPDAQELCNGRDDNCDKKQDEGFDVGMLCAGRELHPGRGLQPGPGLHGSDGVRGGRRHPVRLRHPAVGLLPG
jgi:hypothetical protein